MGRVGSHAGLQVGGWRPIVAHTGFLWPVRAHIHLYGQVSQSRDVKLVDFTEPQVCCSFVGLYSNVFGFSLHVSLHLSIFICLLF